MEMKIAAMLLLSCTVVLAIPANAKDDDPMKGRLFPPELIMQNKSRLGLTESQVQSIIGEMKHFQSEIVEVQFRGMEARQILTDALDASQIDEQVVDDALKTLLGVENQVKRNHIGTLVRIRNELSEKQIEMLRNLQ